MRHLQMILRPCILLFAATVLMSCASTQLNYNTLDLASTTNNLITQQALFNFSSFLDNPAAIPAQVTVSSGNATTSNSVTPTLTAPLNAGLTTTSLFSNNPTTTVANATASKSLSVAASDSWNQTWAFVPVTDPEKMGRLQALYRYAVDWSGKGDYGVAKFVENFPRIQRSISYQKPACLYDTNGSIVKGVVKGTTQPLCATATATNADLTHAATTLTFSEQSDDPYYLTNPHCIVCATHHGRTINRRLRGPWLRWTDLTGANVDPIRAPQSGDVSLGRAGHYEFFAKHDDAQAFVDFTVAILVASGQGGSTAAASASASAGSSGGGGSGPKTLSGLDTAGNPFTLIIPSQ